VKTFKLLCVYDMMIFFLKLNCKIWMKWLSEGLWRWRSRVYELWFIFIRLVWIQLLNLRFLTSMSLPLEPSGPPPQLRVALGHGFESRSPRTAGVRLTPWFSSEPKPFQAHFTGHGCLKRFHRSPGEPPASEAKFSPSKVKQSVTFLCLNSVLAPAPVSDAFD